MFAKFKENIKKNKTPLNTFIYNTYKGIQGVNVRIPMPIVALLYSERTLRNHFFGWLLNKFYYEPLLRYRCCKVGKNVRTDGDLPLIVGSGKIRIGDNVKIGNRCAFLIAANLYDSPELIIGNNSVINYMSGISVEQRVEIGDNCMIAGETMIFDNSSHSIYYKNGRKMTREDVAPVLIEDDVWIGMRSMILKGVHIGRGAVVAACSVVTNDVPPMTLVAGNPAKVIKVIKLPDDIT